MEICRYCNKPVNGEDPYQLADGGALHDDCIVDYTYIPVSGASNSEHLGDLSDTRTSDVVSISPAISGLKRGKFALYWFLIGLVSYGLGVVNGQIIEVPSNFELGLVLMAICTILASVLLVRLAMFRFRDAGIDERWAYLALIPLVALIPFLMGIVVPSKDKQSAGIDRFQSRIKSGVESSSAIATNLAKRTVKGAAAVSRTVISQAPETIDEQLFLRATEEFDSPDRVKAIYYKALALSENDSEKAKAKYVMLRVAQYQSAL